MALRDVDFSNGIRADDIQYNFEEISSEIARERLTLAGHGISQGLKFTVNGFALTIESGSLIDVDGKEVFINETTLNIPLPRLIGTKLSSYTVLEGGQIVLPNVPYSSSRQCPSQYGTAANYGVTITDFSNSSKVIPILLIQSNVLTVDARWTGLTISSVYNYSSKRYDTIYIDKNNEIKVVEGITSNSPSVTLPNALDYKYILGIVEIDPYHVNTDGSISAALSIEKDMKSLRNLYTDSENNLYICGVAFDDLQIIHMAEPSDPYENQLWYDTVGNKLKVWKTIDNIAQWVNVNDTSIIPVREYKIWTPVNNPIGFQTFIFDYIDDMNMRYVPGRNELDLLIDNGPLHSDQFEEITVAGVLADSVLKQLLIDTYNYTDEWLVEVNDKYENLGLGFKLAQPLDKTCYVEARVTHRVNENPVRTRFQRAATFISTDAFTYEATNGKTVTTDAPYRVNECQLEVYIDGKKVEAVRDYTEGVDLEVINRVKGAISHQFLIATDIPEGSRISYKITCNIFSYDDVEMVIGDLKTRVETAETTIVTKNEEIDSFVTTANTNLNSMDTRINTIEGNETEHATFVKKTDVLTTVNMPASINTWIPKSMINTSIIKSGALNPITGVSPEDFVLVFDITASGGNIILERGTDYDITIDEPSGTVYVSLVDVNKVTEGDTLYITGIKFKV